MASYSTISWTERMVRRFAGTMILISVILAWKVHPGWLGLAVFVGLNLLQSSYTNYCPLEKLLRRLESTAKPAPSVAER